MPDLITGILARPRPVAVAGRVYPVWEATLGALADLQAWLEGRTPDPLDGLDGADESALFAALAAAQDGPPEPGTERAGLLLATPEGVCEFLRVALSRGTPGLTPQAVAGLAVGCTAEEFARVYRAFFRAEPVGRIARLILGPDDDGGETGRRVTWAEAVVGLLDEHPAWTLEYVEGLTPTQFGLLRSGGRSEGGALPVRKAEALWAKLRASRIADGA